MLILLEDLREYIRAPCEDRLKCICRGIEASDGHDTQTKLFIVSAIARGLACTELCERIRAYGDCRSVYLSLDDCQFMAIHHLLREWPLPVIIAALAQDAVDSGKEAVERRLLQDVDSLLVRMSARIDTLGGPPAPLYHFLVENVKHGAEILDWLIAHGIVNLPMPDKLTNREDRMICKSVRFDSRLEMTQYLSRRGHAQMRYYDTYETCRGTAFMMACEAGSQKTVKWFLENLNWSDNDLTNALLRDVWKCCDFEYVKMLALAVGVHGIAVLICIVKRLCTQKSLSELAWFMDTYPELTKHTRYIGILLTHAMRHGSLGFVQYLLGLPRVAGTTTVDCTMVPYALRGGNLDIIRLVQSVARAEDYFQADILYAVTERVLKDDNVRLLAGLWRLAPEYVQTALDSKYHWRFKTTTDLNMPRIYATLRGCRPINMSSYDADSKLKYAPITKLLVSDTTNGARMSMLARMYTCAVADVAAQLYALFSHAPVVNKMDSARGMPMWTLSDTQWKDFAVYGMIVSSLPAEVHISISTIVAKNIMDSCKCATYSILCPRLACCLDDAIGEWNRVVDPSRIAFPVEILGTASREEYLCIQKVAKLRYPTEREVAHYQRVLKSSD